MREKKEGEEEEEEEAARNTAYSLRARSARARERGVSEHLTSLEFTNTIT
jgi:hypothetical protein